MMRSCRNQKKLMCPPPWQEQPCPSPTVGPGKALCPFYQLVAAWMVSPSDFWRFAFIPLSHSIFPNWMPHNRLDFPQMNLRCIPGGSSCSLSIPKLFKANLLVYPHNLAITSNVWQFCWLTLKKIFILLPLNLWGPLFLPYSKCVA